MKSISIFTTGRKKKQDSQPIQDEEFLRVPDNDNNVNKQRGQRSKDSRVPETPISNISDAVPLQIPNQMVDYSDDEGEYDDADQYARFAATPTIVPFTVEFADFIDNPSELQRLDNQYITLHTHEERSRMSHKQMKAFAEDASQGIKHPMKPVCIRDILQSQNADKNSKAMQLCLNQVHNHSEFVQRIHKMGMQDSLIMIPTRTKANGIGYEIDPNNPTRESILGNYKKYSLQDVMRTAQI